MIPDLSQKLRALRETLERVPAGVADELRSRAVDRLERDLLPRTAARDGALVVGIVGPNNAGKSALFNALVGASVSPSLPTGGATRRLVGAARPELAKALRGLEGWGRFTIHDWIPDAGSTDVPTTLSEDPAELLLTEVEALPDDVLLIDTPDFDSVMRENRAASEALLAVADVALVVVTRHTYQNAALVDFLRTWLEHGRPWVLVYNEAPTPEIALDHASKLALDLGSAPLEVFQSPTDLRVMEGTAPLDPLAARGAGSLRLVDFLRDFDAVTEVKAAALEASLGQLGADVDGLAEALDRRGEAAARVFEHALGAATAVGTRVASEAMPAGPFLAAFRSVLDRRSNKVSRRFRASLGGLRARMESLPGLLRGRRPTAVTDTGGGLERVELPLLERAWPEFFEELARDLGPEGRATVRGSCPAPLATLLDQDLGRPLGAGAEKVQDLVADLPVDLDAFQRSCEVLVEQALDERGRDFDIQALADLATVLPVAIAAVVIVKTGGFGADLGVAGGSVATSFLLDKYKHVLGSSVTREARRQWERQRGQVLARAVLQAALPMAAEPLEQSADQDAALAAELAAHLSDTVDRKSTEQSRNPGGSEA